jgi:hypothetical protein
LTTPIFGGIFYPKIFPKFSNKNTHKVFFTHTLRLRDYPPFLTIIGGGRGGGIRPPISGEGYRGVFTGRGITKTPYVIMRGEDVSLIYTSNVMRSY